MQVTEAVRTRHAINRYDSRHQVPEDYSIAFMIAIGKGAKDAWPRPGQLKLNEIMVTGRLS
jgi:hypothetical protein